jgi:hypothetical protein
LLCAKPCLNSLAASDCDSGFLAHKSLPNPLDA